MRELSHWPCPRCWESAAVPATESEVTTGDTGKPQGMGRWPNRPREGTVVDLSCRDSALPSACAILMERERGSACRELLISRMLLLMSTLGRLSLCSWGAQLGVSVSAGPHACVSAEHLCAAVHFDKSI